MPFIDTPRMRFHYRTHGDPEGIPMVLLHGSYASSRWWLPLFQILPDEIFAIAPDLRGCGESAKTESGYDISEQAEDILAFVQALGLSDFDLVGHSSGGAIAIEFALTYPEIPRTLILVDSAPIEGVFTPLEGYVLLDKMRSDVELLERALRTLMPTVPPPTMSEDEFAQYFDQLLSDVQQMAPAAFTEVARALDRWNRFEEANSLTLPTLLLWGSEDTLVDKDAMTRTLLAIPGANNLDILRGIGHSPMIESPVALAEHIIDFITEDFDTFEEAKGLAEDHTGDPDLSAGATIEYD